jgi:hypothetical protein
MVTAKKKYGNCHSQQKLQKTSLFAKTAKTSLFAKFWSCCVGVQGGVGGVAVGL